MLKLLTPNFDNGSLCGWHAYWNRSPHCSFDSKHDGRIPPVLRGEGRRVLDRAPFFKVGGALMAILPKLLDNNIFKDIW